MRLRHAAVVAGLALGLMSGAAHAAFIATITEVGSDVVVNGSGTLNTSLLTLQTEGSALPSVSPSAGILTIGPLSLPDDDIYTGPFTFTSNFGTGGSHKASAGSGDLVGYDYGGGDPEILLPHGYVSGSTLTDMSTYNNQSFATLGLTPGDYTYTFSKGAVSDSFEIDVVSPGIVSAVPLPASAPMFGAALVALSAVGYGLKRKAKAAA